MKPIVPAPTIGLNINDLSTGVAATRDVPGKEREKNRNGKETGKNAFLSSPVPLFFDDLFFLLLSKIVKNG